MHVTFLIKSALLLSTLLVCIIRPAAAQKSRRYTAAETLLDLQGLKIFWEEYSPVELTWETHSSSCSSFFST